MAMEFLTDAQVAGYGRFDGVPSRADLERFFVLDEADRNLRGDPHRLGLMLQATTVRFLGRFLDDPAGCAVAGGGVPRRAAGDRRRVVREARERVAFGVEDDPRSR